MTVLRLSAGNIILVLLSLTEGGLSELEVKVKTMLSHQVCLESARV